MKIKEIVIYEFKELSKEAKESVYSDFKRIYYSICEEIEKAGYAELDYRMSAEEFADHCQTNGYTFAENGKMENI